MANDAFCDAAEHSMLQPGVTVCAEDNQIRAGLACGGDDDFPRLAGFDEWTTEMDSACLRLAQRGELMSRPFTQEALSLAGDGSFHEKSGRHRFDDVQQYEGSAGEFRECCSLRERGDGTVGEITRNQDLFWK